MTAHAPPHQTEPETTQPTQPIECPRCGYDLTGTNSFTCSECGYLSVPEDAAVATQRQVFLRQSILKLNTSTAVVLTVTYLIVLALLQQTRAQIPGWILFSITTLTVTYALIVTKFIPQHRRHLTRRLWVATCAYLHLPFYAGLGASLIFILIDLLLPGNHLSILFLKSTSTLILLVLWGWASGAAFLRWNHLYHRLADDSWWTQQNLTRTLYQRGIVTIYALNVLLGLVTFWVIVIWIIL